MCPEVIIWRLQNLVLFPVATLQIKRVFHLLHSPKYFLVIFKFLCELYTMSKLKKSELQESEEYIILPTKTDNVI